MASTLAPTITPDTVVSFEINPGPGRSSVSPGKSHETTGSRMDLLILAVCLELGVRYTVLASTPWTLPLGAGDTAYEADKAYSIQSQGTAERQQPPDLAIEVVVSHAETKALWAGAFLKIPETWVVDLPRHRLTFYHLAVRGKQQRAYRPRARSRAFPVLSSTEVLERLDDPETDDATFHENCRGWARQVDVPRRRAENGGV